MNLQTGSVAVLLLLAASCGGSKDAPATVGRGVVPGAAARADRPPVAERRPVTDRHHGVAVEDAYRWLEEDSAEVKAWSDGQNRYARAHLDHLPEVDALRAEVRAIIAAPTVSYLGLKSAGGKWFAYRKDPAREQPVLIVMDDLERPGDARLILDPTAQGGAHRSIDWFEPSLDGTRVAVSLSEGGSESGTLHMLGVDGAEIDKPIENVQRGTGGGDVTWTADGKGLWYTRYPAAGEKPEAERDFWMQVWFHELGADPATDRYELGKDLPRIAEFMLESDARGRVIASVQNGDGGTFRHYLRSAKGTWTQLDDWDDGIVHASFGPTADLWLISQAGAPRGKILRLPASAKSASRAVVVVPEGKDAIKYDFYEGSGLVVQQDRIHAIVLTGGPSEVRSFTLSGKPVASVKLPPVSAVSHLAPAGRDLVFGVASYVAPFRWVRLDRRSGTLTELAAISPKPPVDLSGWEVHREFATSKDGTRVPYNVVWQKGAPLDGSVPCVATGYGGFGFNQEPAFLETMSLETTAPLLRRGLCFVTANLRGGAELGEEWHRAGALTHKQNVFDDFAAVLGDLAARRYTSPDRLAIIGSSNGGLLMGAIITQHPELVRAVVSRVGIYDMLRVELSSNGSYNIPEFGTVTDEAQFKAMYAYSPYHHVTPRKYPAVLFTTGTNDPRVAPWHSRKMIAALQAAQQGGAPILLRTSETAGHGIGTGMSEQIDDDAHADAFLLSQIRGTPAAR